MIEYKTYIPEDLAADQTHVAQATMSICFELSRQVSYTDNSEDYFSQALANVTKRQSRKGGIWIHSFLDMDRTEYYTFMVSNLPLAKVHEPVDFTEQELAEHLARKAGQHVG